MKGTIETGKLAEAGLVIKSRSQSDERVVELSVTEAGFHLLDQLAPVQRKVNDEEFASLSADDFQELHRLVRLLIANGDRALALQRFLNFR